MPHIAILLNELDVADLRVVLEEQAARHPSRRPLAYRVLDRIDAAVDETKRTGPTTADFTRISFPHR